MPARAHDFSALETCPLAELVAMDNTYLERIQVRKSIMDEHPNDTYLCNPSCEPAVMELYEWMFGTYLPQRFPTMFKLVNPDQLPTDFKTRGRYVHNIPTDEYIPLKASSGRDALYALGRQVDDEFLLLLPSSSAEDGSPIYHLEAFVCCFPSGFSTPDKLGLPLAGIHKPVPGYEQKLEKSMDRFFAKMELGKAVRRVNWAITTNTKLFTLGGNHLYADGTTKESSGTKVVNPASWPLTAPSAENNKTLDLNSTNLEQSIQQQKKDVVIDNCCLRSERQTLHRLPVSRALVFAFKTYQYRLDNVKAEGNGPALADAIEGLSKGSVPDMAFYKRGVVWGDKVVEYMRS